VFKLSAANVYCVYFNGRAVPWAFPLEFACKYRVESRVCKISDGAEKAKLAKILFSLSLIVNIGLDVDSTCMFGSYPLKNIIYSSLGQGLKC